MNRTSSRILLVMVAALALAVASCEEVDDAGESALTTTEATDGDLRERLAAVLEGQVTEFQIVELDMPAVVEGLQAGILVVPVVDPDNQIVEIESPAVQVQLRVRGLEEGVLRSEEGQELVPLTAEQNYWLGDCVEDRQSGGCGALTIIDEAQTMLSAAYFDGQTGATYIEAVDPLLGNADDPQFPRFHVLYHTVNTTEEGFPEDDPLAWGEGFAGGPGIASGRLLLYQTPVTRSTNIVIDSDVTFYNAGKSTVWSRQEAIFNVVSVIYRLMEPNSTDASPDNASWGLTLTIKGQETWISGGPTTTNKVALTNVITDPNYYLITSVDDDELHHLIVGYDVIDVYGRASGIGTSAAFGGAAGLNHAYSEALTSQTLKSRWVVMAHELGHVIGGQHSLGVTSGCSQLLFFQFCGASLMPAGSAGEPSTRQPYFSDANDAAIGAVLQGVL